MPFMSLCSTIRFATPGGQGLLARGGWPLVPPTRDWWPCPPPVSRTDPAVEVRARPRPWRRGTPALAGDGHDDVLVRRALGLVAGRPDVARDDRVLGRADLGRLRRDHQPHP